MKKICLINPPIDLKDFYWEVKLGSKLPPLGLCSLAAYIRSKGHEVFLIDALNRGMSPDEVVARINQIGPDLAGITATTSFIESAHQCAQKIKAQCGKVTTIIGGSHVSAVPMQTIEEFPAFDLGVVGEGETTVLEILEASDRDYPEIDGLVFRDQGRPAMTRPRDRIKNLDELPYPALDLLEGFPDLYQPTPNNYRKKPVLSMVTSRGCPFSCTFCDQSVFGHRVRAFSLQYVADMIRFYQDRFGIREVSFYDDLFTFNKQRLIDFMEALNRARVKITWSCESRIDTVTDDSLRIMKESGCWQISYGIESGSQRILDYFNKRITVEDIEKAVNLTHKWGIRSRAYLIVGAPPEDQASIAETRDLVRRLPIDDLHISFFAPIPGSKAFKDIIGDKAVRWKDMDLYRVGYTPPGISAEELQGAVKGIYRQFYLQPKILFRYASMLFNPHKSLELFQKGLIFLLLLFKREKYH
jgi:anaerobic magnesium-protoporphyrin IX monomethyl ester cyclase